jgi:squamous cell carcinoma antigen recognized by T-cells 3
VVSILERATRNCPWSGDLWAFYIRFLAQMDNCPFGNLITVKEKAVAVSWLSSQPAELAKFWCAWLSLCRLAVVDWDSQSEEVQFLESELSECLETVGKRKPRICSRAHIIDFTSPDEYIIGRLLIYLKTQLNNDEEARDIWDLMSKANASRCNYWLDRIAWER